MNQHHYDIPHVRIVVAVCIAAVLGYAGFSIYAVVVLRDPSLTGDIIGTWKSFAVLAFGFWLGSSSGGKAKQDQPSGKPGDPVSVNEEGRGLSEGPTPLPNQPN